MKDDQMQKLIKLCEEQSETIKKQAEQITDLLILLQQKETELEEEIKQYRALTDEEELMLERKTND